MTTVIVVLFIAVLLVGGFLWSRSLKAKDAEHAKIVAAKDAWAAEARIAHAAVIGSVQRHARRATRAEADLDWERTMHAVTQAERDMYQTALRGELTRQVRQELLRPDEQAEEGTVVEFPVRGRA